MPARLSLFVGKHLPTSVERMSGFGLLFSLILSSISCSTDCELKQSFDDSSGDVNHKLHGHVLARLSLNIVDPVANVTLKRSKAH